MQVIVCVAVRRFGQHDRQRKEIAMIEAAVITPAFRPAIVGRATHRSATNPSTAAKARIGQRFAKDKG